MVDIEDLKQRFVVKSCPPWGNCIIVPGSEFRKSWERELYDQSINCIHTDFGNINRPVVLVRLDPAEASELAGVQVPSSQGQGINRIHTEFGDTPKPAAGLQRVLKGKNTTLGPRWTEDDYKLLITLWNEHKKVGEIATNFPNRSHHAVACALARLKNSGAIKPRWTHKKNRLSESEEEDVAISLKEIQEGKSKRFKTAGEVIADLKKSEAETPQQPQEHPGEPLKPNLVCTVSIHVEAKSAASIKAVITLLKELKAK